jgi:hypothetical protein
MKSPLNSVFEVLRLREFLLVLFVLYVCPISRCTQTQTHGTPDGADTLGVVSKKM